MITAIDFGCYAIRSAYRTPADQTRITMITERSEYAVLSNQSSCRETVIDRNIPCAECNDSTIVFGHHTEQIRWLSRKPCAPLFADAASPTDDAPARQILSILTEAMLPRNVSKPTDCFFTVPRGRLNPENVKFLSHLTRMHGFEPRYFSAAPAVLLSSGSDSRYTGVAIVIGAESSEISVSRYGIELAAETIPVGANWIDTELARQYEIRTWDETGECYLDLETVRQWKHDPGIHLRNSVGERERTLARLYGEVLNRIARSTRDLLNSPAVKSALGDDRLTVYCAGGPTQIGGFASTLTERFVEHETADRILTIRAVDDAETAVVRGLLIQGELEARRRSPLKSAA
ncbi:MAG: hypothetical protein P8K08_13800 [Fuerstiella sp.]|jgi:hypothetical protein|nr:hypothetical protein [Fuerstiella sp.]